MAHLLESPAAIGGMRPTRTDSHNHPLRLGVGGPVGSGKTMLVRRIIEQLGSKVNLAVVTNDIYTKEDAEFLSRLGIIDGTRIIGVETGGCPHSAIREDVSMNLAAIDELRNRHADLELIIVESGGDNLTAMFSPDLADETIYVIDVAQGDKIPRKGGPGLSRSGLLVINKINLAPLVGADTAVMVRDAAKLREQRPTMLCDLKDMIGFESIAHWITSQVRR